MPHDKLRNLFEKERSVILAYIFGSRVSGTPGPLSDYDFAILVEKGKEKDYDYKYYLINKLSHILDTDKIDLVILNKAPYELSYQVISSGKVLYKRSEEERIDFETYILNMYLDFLHVLEDQRKELLYKEDLIGLRTKRYRKAFRETLRLLGEVKDSFRKT